jgi:hypothetical protein
MMQDPQMDIHKPKPIRNWREFLKEYAIIVIGVATALAAEQAVEWWHWKSQVAEARALIASELANQVRQSIYRLRVEKCAERRADELGAILDSASKTGALPPLGDIGTPPRGVWITGAWDSAQASQAAVHFPREQLAALGRTYKFVQKGDEFSGMEGTQWSELYAMVGPGRRLDVASEARLRSALSQARALNRLMTSIAINIIRSTHDLDLPFSSADLKSIARGRSDPLAKSRDEFNPLGNHCLPIEKAPAVYGQSGLKYLPSASEQSLQTLPNFGKEAR